MKHVFLFLMVFVAIAMNAQVFEITPNGLKDVKENKNFVVLEFPNLSKSDLYYKSIKYIHRSFKNPERVITSDIKDESVRYVSYKPNGINVKNGGARINIDIKYSVQLDFKDGRVKYEIVDQDFGALSFIGSIWRGYPIWNEKNGKLRLPDEKAELENHFNSIVLDYVNFVNGVSEKDNDW